MDDPPAGAGFPLRIDPWYDLVYHVLSYLPNESDASNLYDARYVAWCEARLGAGASGEEAAPRTLTTDAGLLTFLYSTSRQGFLLHAWPSLHDGIEDFHRRARTDFRKLKWCSAERKKLADRIVANTHPGLPDLFRTALWGELEAGYEAFWRTHIAPRSERFQATFRRQLDELVHALPEVAEAVWVLSHPLRTHGRLLRSASSQPTIVVGVADDELGVTEWGPAVQGCHEVFVAVEQSAAPRGADWSTAVGARGFLQFLATERAALRRGARCFLGSPWEDQYLAWLARIIPHVPAEEAARQLAEGASR